MEALSGSPRKFENSHFDFSESPRKYIDYENCKLARLITKIFENECCASYSEVELKGDQHGLYVRVSSRDKRGAVARSDIEGGLVRRGGKVDVHL